MGYVETILVFSIVFVPFSFFFHFAVLSCLTRETEGEEEGIEGDQQTESNKEEKQESKVEDDSLALQPLKVKWWVWAILVSALFAVSSAGLYSFLSLF